MEALLKHPAKQMLDIAEATYEQFAVGLERCGFVPVTSSKDGDHYWFSPRPVDPTFGFHVEWGYSVSLRGEDYVPRHEFCITFAYPGNPDDAADWGMLRLWDEEGYPKIEVVDLTDGREPPPHVREFLSGVGLAPGEVKADEELIERVVTAAAKIHNSLPPAFAV